MEQADSKAKIHDDQKNPDMAAVLFVPDAGENIIPARYLNSWKR